MQGRLLFAYILSFAVIPLHFFTRDMTDGCYVRWILLADIWSSIAILNILYRINKFYTTSGDEIIQFVQFSSSHLFWNFCKKRTRDDECALPTHTRGKWKLRDSNLENKNKKEETGGKTWLPNSHQVKPKIMIIIIIIRKRKKIKERKRKKFQF